MNRDYDVNLHKTIGGIPAVLLRWVRRLRRGVMSCRGVIIDASHSYICHIKVDWETLQIIMKCRDKLGLPMAGPSYP